jgi:hypothetical protein
VTPVLEVPLTEAVNCCFPPAVRATVDGETETATLAAGATLIVNSFVTEFADAET